MRILITGSCGFLGSQAVEFFAKRGNAVVGVDGGTEEVSARDKVKEFLHQHFAKDYQSRTIQLCDEGAVLELMKETRPDFVLLAGAHASSPSLQSEPKLDDETHLMETRNMLEGIFRFCPESPVVYLSSYRVCGEAPNQLSVTSGPLRYEFAQEHSGTGVGEKVIQDPSVRSPFGQTAWKAENLCREFFQNHPSMKRGIFRLSLLTGATAGTSGDDAFSELVEFGLSGRVCPLHLYEGKQVRDFVSVADLMTALDLFRGSPRQGETYHLGGGVNGSYSILELVVQFKKKLGINLKTKLLSKNIPGEPKCYYADNRKFIGHYPAFQLTTDMDSLLDTLAKSLKNRSAA